jgi:Tol biopolymer transport system component
LWRSRVDGSDRVQLTFPPIEVVGPRWSPDGIHIAFTDLQPGKLWKICVIPALGGTAQGIYPGDNRAEIDPSWGTDGKSIVFGRSYFAGRGGIERMDLTTHEVSSVPGSEEAFSPRLSPDGSKIAAFFEQGSRLMVYDVRSGKWHDAARGIFQFNNWSRDGKSIYMLDMQHGNTIVRFDVDRGKLADIVDLQGIEQGSKGWLGLTLDDSPLIRCVQTFV